MYFEFTLDENRQRLRRAKYNVTEDNTQFDPRATKDNYVVMETTVLLQKSKNEKNLYSSTVFHGNSGSGKKFSRYNIDQNLPTMLPRPTSNRPPSAHTSSTRNISNKIAINEMNNPSLSFGADQNFLSTSRRQQQILVSQKSKVADQNKSVNYTNDIEYEKSHLTGNKTSSASNSLTYLALIRIIVITFLHQINFIV